MLQNSINNKWLQEVPLYFTEGLESALGYYSSKKYEDVIFKAVTRIEYILRATYMHLDNSDKTCRIVHKKASSINSFMKQLSQCSYSEQLSQFWKTINLLLILELPPQNPMGK